MDAVDGHARYDRHVDSDHFLLALRSLRGLPGALGLRCAEAAACEGGIIAVTLSTVATLVAKYQQRPK